MLGVVEYGLTGREAVDLKRMHHQWLPDRTTVEPDGASDETIAKLKAMGHNSAAYLHLAAALPWIREPSQSLFRMQPLDVIEEEGLAGNARERGGLIPKRGPFLRGQIRQHLSMRCDERLVRGQARLDPVPDGELQVPADELLLDRGALRDPLRARHHQTAPGRLSAVYEYR